MDTAEITPKATIQITATVTYKGELQIFRRNTKPDFSKKMVDLVTSDNQRLYCEIRNSNIPKLERIEVDDVVLVEILFAGSEKNDKKYNNLYIINIQKK